VERSRPAVAASLKLQTKAVIEAMPNKKRRTTLVAFAAALATSILPHRLSRAGECDEPKTPMLDTIEAAKDKTQDASHIRISIHEPGGKLYTKLASVSLRRGQLSVDANRIGLSNIYEASVSPGDYDVIVVASSYSAPKNHIRVKRNREKVAVYLGFPGWSSYRLGRTLVPFDPVDNLLAVVFTLSIPTPSQEEDILKALTAIKVKPYFRDIERTKSFKNTSNSVWILQSTEPTKQFFGRFQDQLIPLTKISPLLDRIKGVRIGIPTDLRNNQIKVLDNRHIVRFANDKGLKQAEVCGFIKPIRKMDHAPNTWLIEFPESFNYQSHLDQIESWISKGFATNAEPDLLFEVVKAGSCDPGVQSDPFASCQSQFQRQKIFDAWCFIEEEVDSSIKYGSPSVKVAILDDGLIATHPDIPRLLPDENEKSGVGYYSELDGNVCNEPPNHGTAVFGIFAAAKNDDAIVGVAPGTHQVVVRLPSGCGGNTSMTSLSFYSETLLWISGLRSDPPTGATAPVLDTPAHVINCSHEWVGTPLSDTICLTFDKLTKCGRSGKGVVLVYAIGNGGHSIEGYSGFANDEHVIAVGNTHRTNNYEVIHSSSNYGGNICICAMGQDVPSLSDIGGLALNCNGQNVSGVATFNQTSAATPMVSGAIALMLSVDPSLNWKEIRRILCENASRPIEDQELGPYDLGGGPTWTFHEYYGYGRLNVLNAVKAVRKKPASRNIVADPYLACDSECDQQ
jgi:subtilisin family serine protease